MAGLLALVCFLWLLADDLAVAAGWIAEANLRDAYARERAVEKWRAER